MANITEILTIEKERDPECFPTDIHLFEEGSFFRAYERSAWLCVSFIRKFKANRKQVKNSDDSFAFIGFPITSLAKFTLEGAEVEEVNEKHLVMHLPASTFGDAPDPQKATEDFENWKQSVPLAVSKKTQKAAELPFDDPFSPNASAPRATRISDVVQQILAFPLERKSPMECMQFVSELREQLSRLI